jgi:hypothetical protein
MSDRKPRRRVLVHLKSGHTLKFRATEFTVNYTGGRISGYSYSGVPVRNWYGRAIRRPLAINPEDITAVEAYGD